MRLSLDPQVPDLSALGARGIEDFLDGGRGLVTARRVELLSSEPRRSLLRVPLPGTPDSSGQRLEPPRGAGTGWLRVHVFESRAVELLRARLSAPPSTSPAARRWNLLCHLRAQGVGAPRPMALLEERRGLGSISVCVEAELSSADLAPTEDPARARDPGGEFGRR